MLTWEEKVRLEEEERNKGDLIYVSLEFPQDGWERIKRAEI